MIIQLGPSSVRQNNKADPSFYYFSGKVERVSVKTQSTRGFSNRTDRRNAARLLQQKKREELFRKTKIFDGKDGTPKVVAVVPLCPDVSAEDAVANLFASVDQVPANKGAVLMT